MPNNILIFKTNVTTLSQVKAMDRVFSSHTEIVRWNLDIDDCDKVLRIEPGSLQAEQLLGELERHSIFCEDLV